MHHLIDESHIMWVPVKRLCETVKVDYCRAREKLLKTDIPKRKMKVKGRDGKRYAMWCIPDYTIERYHNEVAAYKRGPYRKRRQR